MPVVAGAVTTLARQYWPQFFGGLLGISSGATTPGDWNPLITTFRVGRGGWVDPGTGKVPRTPDPALTDLDVIVDASRAALDQRYTTLTGNILFFEKSFIEADFTFASPSTLQIDCLLDFSEFNDIQGTPTTPPGGSPLSPSGTGPDLYELGLFSDHPSGSGKLMVVYGTFPLEYKDASKQISNVVKIAF